MFRLFYVRGTTSDHIYSTTAICTLNNSYISTKTTSGRAELSICIYGYPCKYGWIHIFPLNEMLCEVPSKVQLILLQGFCNFDQPGNCYFRALCFICLCFLQACKGNYMNTQKRNMHNTDSRYCGGNGLIYFSFVTLCFTLILWDSFVAMVTNYTNQSESTVLWWMYVSAMNITIYSDYDWSQCRQHSFTPDHKSVSVQTLSCWFK